MKPMLCLLALAAVTCCVRAQINPPVNVALNKPAFQQTLYSTAVAGNAVDGDLKTTSCTLYNDNSWWALDLGLQYRVTDVEVVNDNNANFPNRLNNFLVKLMNVQPTPGQPILAKDFTLCAQYSGNVALLGTAKVSCPENLPPFRYVVVQSSLANNAICLTEVRVYGDANVAYNKPAFEQTLYNSAVAANANDGKLATVSCTLYNDYSWWAVDLGLQFRVREVEVINDNNGNFPNRLNNFLVKLMNVQPTTGQPILTKDFTLCAQYSGQVALMGTATITCPTTLPPFRYVVVQSSLTNNAICLTEVRVFGDANLAYKKTAYEQSVYPTAVASNANDGDLGSASCTLYHTNPWWAVDLGDQYYVREVEIVNDRNANFPNRLNNFVVKLLNVQPTPGQSPPVDYALCATFSGNVTILGTVKVSCAPTPLRYRYVVVQSLLKDDAICLTEVRVYNKWSWVDPCSRTPCLNGGKCSSTQGTADYTCQCTSTFTGKDCQTAVDPCTASTSPVCLNGGKCSGTPGTTNYTCHCPTSFTGKNCETGVDPCTVQTTSPCLNGGKCIGVAGTTTVSCQCASGFIGSSCEHVDYCASKPCKNGGNCTSLHEGFICSCQSGFAGLTCTMDAAACSAVNSTSQLNCGWGRITADQCNARSCCFNAKPPAGSPACFFQAADCPSISLDDRVDCRGSSTILTSVMCNGRGCCYDKSAANTGPVCYRQAKDPKCIGVAVHNRVSRGTANTMPNDCESKGFCWDSSVGDSNLWCFSVK